MAAVGNFAGGFMRAFAAARDRKEQKEQAEKELKARTQLFEIQARRAQREEEQQQQQLTAQAELAERWKTMGSMTLPAGNKFSLSDLLSDQQNAMLLLRSGWVSGKDLITSQQAPQEPESIRTLRALAADPALMEAEMQRRRAGAGNTTVNLGDRGLTPPPPGFFRPDPTKPGLNIEPGGPAAAEAAERAAHEAATVKTVVNKSEGVLGAITEALDLVSPLTTGFTGTQFAKIEGTPSYNLSKTLETIKANIGFDRLQEMRAASPTGGALGQVAVKELEGLQASIASLDQGLSHKKLKDNLLKIQTHYDNWKKAVQGAAVIHEQGAMGKPPAGIPPGSVQIGTSGGKPVYQTPDGQKLIVE